jgi:hypothetical protein
VAGQNLIDSGMLSDHAFVVDPALIGVPLLDE